jgi:predicted SprT family Zn-dependent metalloprotease
MNQGTLCHPTARGSFSKERPIRGLIDKTLQQLEHDNIAVQWRFDGRLTRSLGIAHWPEDLVLLSIPQWHRIPARERRETIVHEVCHLTTWHELGYIPDNHHCDMWHQHMDHCGYDNPSIKVDL